MILKRSFFHQKNRSSVAFFVQNVIFFRTDILPIMFYPLTVYCNSKTITVIYILKIQIQNVNTHVLC